MIDGGDKVTVLSPDIARIDLGKGKHIDVHPRIALRLLELYGATIGMAARELTVMNVFSIAKGEQS